MTSSIFALDVLKCSHNPEKKSSFEVIDFSSTFSEVFDRFHGKISDHVDDFETCIDVAHSRCASALSVGSVEWRTVVDGAISISGLKSLYDFSHIRLKCLEKTSTLEVESPPVNPGPNSSKPKANAFEVLMGSRGTYQFVEAKPEPSASTLSTGEPTGKRKGLTRKDELYNDLANLLREKNLSFHCQNIESEGTYIVQVLCNALWYNQPPQND